jgi:Ser/Thr protein kinase RdoA (MazF antagonist)
MQSDDRLAEAVAARRFGSAVRVVHLTRSSGLVYRVSMADGRWILKLARNAGDHSIAKEARVIDLLRQHGVAAPRVEFCGVNDVSARRSFLLMVSAGDQTAMDYLADPEHNASSLLAEMGNTLAAIHSITLPASGDIQADAIVPHNTQAQMQRLHRLADWAAVQQLLRPDETALFKRLPMPDIDGTSLCHMDFNAVNCVVSDGHIAAVVDWESAWAANPLIDLAIAHSYLEYHCPEDAVRCFLDAYAASRPIPADYPATYLPVCLAHLLGLMWVWNSRGLAANVRRAAKIFTALCASRR